MNLETSAKIAPGATCVLVLRPASRVSLIYLELAPASLSLVEVKLGNVLARLARLPEDPRGRWYFAKQRGRLDPLVGLTALVRNDGDEPVDATLTIFGAGISGAP